MANKLLICISMNGATTARWRSGRLTDCETFGDDDKGIAAFRAYAAATAGTPAFIIVDAVEEDYRFETLPHASWSDRAQMVERKLRQHYRGSPYTAGMLVGRDSSKRRDDRFLFSALTNPDLVAPWLAVLNEIGLPIGGVYLLPMVIPGLVAALKTGAQNLLLVAAHPAGIRLTFFKEGAFRLSRLSKGEEAAIETRAIINEISSTRLYLHALRAATLDQTVAVVLLDHENRLDDAPRAINEDNPTLKCSRLGRTDIAKLLKLDSSLLAQSPAVIYLHLLGARVPQNNLAAAAITSGYRRYRSRRWLFAASACAVAISIAWAGFNLLQQLSIADQTEDTARQTARVNVEYQAATRQFPRAPTSANNLRKTTELASKLRTNEKTPGPFFAIVGRAVDKSPQLVLVEVNWQYGRIGVEAASATAQPTVNRGGGATSSRKESGLLSGRVRDFKGDFRGAIASINALANRLRTDPAVEAVRVVQLPLNVSPSLSLSGNTAANRVTSSTAEFKIVVVLKQMT